MLMLHIELVTFISLFLCIFVECKVFTYQLLYKKIFFYSQYTQSHTKINPGVALSQVGEIFWSYVFIFIYCEFGQRVNAAFAKLNDVLGQFDWYSYPKNIQRMLPMIIGGIQQPVNIQGYGDFPCNRLAFQNVGISSLENEKQYSNNKM